MIEEMTKLAYDKKRNELEESFFNSLKEAQRKFDIEVRAITMGYMQDSIELSQNSEVNQWTRK